VPDGRGRGRATRTARSESPDAARPSAGAQSQVAALVEALYPELHRLAAAYMRRERPGQTIQTTALVHEAYLRLAKDRGVAWQNRAHFCAIAANAMRQILVERARARHAAKRGGGAERITLVEGITRAPADPLDQVDIIALHEALERLAEVDPERARLVEMRYFGGLTIEETAEALALSPATVKRSWALARAWLRRELQGQAGKSADG
jgi:RNA polymerase sigma factor (TIGR02999 family)